MLEFLRVTWLIGFFLSIPVMGISFFVFDAAAAGKNIFAYMIFGSMFLSPFCLLAGFILSHHYTKFIYLPLVNIIAFIIGMLGMQITMGGRFGP